MSQQSELADWVYSRLPDGPIPASRLVLLVREKWGAIAEPQAVHLFVSESLACLLRNEDVEAGDLLDEVFLPWRTEPSDSALKINDELSVYETYLEDPSRYVFRKKK
jgi:hypothetical protein